MKIKEWLETTLFVNILARLFEIKENLWPLVTVDYVIVIDFSTFAELYPYACNLYCGN